MRLQGVYILAIVSLAAAVPALAGEPTGACCLGNGSCTAEVTEEDCTGSWLEDSDCDSCPPINDTCDAAIPLTIGTSVTGDTNAATQDSVGNCGTSQASSGVWYSLVGDGSTLTLSTCNGGSNFDTKIQVFCDCDTFGCVAGNDDDNSCGFSNFRSTVSWCSESGVTYYIHVGGFGGDTGFFELSVSTNDNACSPVPSCARGACCLEEKTAGLCIELTQAGCASEFGSYVGDGTTCDNVNCDTGACCHDQTGVVAGGTPGGSACSKLSFDECQAISGVYGGDGTTCDPNPCPQTGACCGAHGFAVVAGNGDCSETTADNCLGGGGVYLGDGTECGDNICNSAGACCYENIDLVVAGPVPGIFCAQLSAESCGQRNGTYFGDGTVCEIDTCHGACCFDPPVPVPGGNLVNCFTISSGQCMGQFDGEFQGPGTSCDAGTCPFPRVSTTHKGSVLVFSNVEVRWSAAAGFVAGVDSPAPLQDTVLSLVNDYPEDVFVQLYFVNGDRPLDAIVAGDPPMIVAQAEPGWNWVDCSLELTHDQPTYWSAATGLPMGCQSFDVLDPEGPGRPDPENPGQRILRGFVVAWAVNERGEEIAWNQLSGSATIIHYGDASAWEYEAWAFQAVAGPQGAQTGSPGELHLDGVEFEGAFDLLLLDFYEPNSAALSSDGTTVIVDTDLTLHPVSADLRQDTKGPVTTKAKFDIWDENERGYSGTTRCITCWDQTLLSLYGTPNNFMALQTDRAKARIDGQQSEVCDVNCIREEDPAIAPAGSVAGIPFFDFDVVCSQEAAILGVAAKVLTFSGATTGREIAGKPLVGQGNQAAEINYDILRPPGTATKTKRVVRDGKR